MANKALFASARGPLSPPADAVNEAGGAAYALLPKAALAQYATTGCLNATFYASAGTQLDAVRDLCGRVEPDYIARCAVHARERGYMKDMPALLLAVLSGRDPGLFRRVFDRVIDGPKMLRTFVQIMRSGAAGRKSFGSAPRACIRAWLAARSDEALFRGSIGNDPSLADVIRMVHPKPATESRRALYGYLSGRNTAEHAVKDFALPAIVQEYERWKRERSGAVPDVPFQMFDALGLTTEQWADVARRAPWQMARMNLNTFARHGVFGLPKMADVVAAKLRDPEAIARARAFPYQLLAAFRHVGDDVPMAVRLALQDAMEIATRNVPAWGERVVVCPDVSGSMSSPVTGDRPGATSAVRCIDVAALVAATVLRQNPTADVLPFAEGVRRVALNPRDSVMTNADRLARIGGGGTACWAPLAELNGNRAAVDLVVLVSDNQSWVEAGGERSPWAATGTTLMREWGALKARCPKARMVLIDVQPYATVQAPAGGDVLLVGGFSDAVFDVVAAFSGGADGNAWVKQIEEVSL